ncbi:diacylglycerol kinase family protein [Streptomyces sp. NPDC005283]|uniref:diacylglycerol kinase family protein n=1 Tax=Streptomyces sp. NPDC005283 TaxID=3156871 RepID=UPI0034565AF2
MRQRLRLSQPPVRELFRRATAAPAASARWAAVGRVADSELLWYGAAALLGLSGGRTTRRAALRGAGSFAIASAITKALSQPALRRTGAGPGRPARLSRKGSVAALSPSGPAAVAAAFTIGVALEAPRLGAVVAPLATALAGSRIHRAGLRHRGAVLAGITIGAGVATLTSRWWPVIPDTPAEAVRPRQAAPELPLGKGLFLVVNPGSGIATLPGSASTVERLQALLPEAQLTELSPEDDLPAVLDAAAREAKRNGGALGMCGGDGSINAAAQAAMGHRVPLAVFPGGTFNHFAADLGIESMQDVLDAITAGDAVTVDLGRADPADGSETKVFLNTFSLGVYPELVHAREGLQARIGKWPALALGLARVLTNSRPINIAVNGRPRRLWLLFAGNGIYHPAGFAPTYRARLDDGLLDVRAVDGDASWARTRLLLAVLTGTLHNSRVLTTTQLRTLRIDAIDEDPHFAYDGEVTTTPAPGLVLGKTHHALTVYRPARGEDPWPM